LITTSASGQPLKKQLQRLYQIEHNKDKVNHQVTQNLAKLLSSPVRVECLHEVVELLPGVLVLSGAKGAVARIVGNGVVHVAGRKATGTVAQARCHLQIGAGDAAVGGAAVLLIRHRDLHGGR
jgi:hypothetical protein